MIGGDPSDMDVSHGICRDCLSDSLSKPVGSLETLLDKIDLPVLLVNEDGAVVCENRMALSVLGKSKVDVEGFMGGDVFDCIHSSKPGGCGKTIHCKACTIRNTVEETYRTGNAFNRIPATLKVVKNAMTRDISSYISTNKAGDFVVLRIEDLKSR